MAEKNYQPPIGVILVEIYGFLVGIANIAEGILLIANHNNGLIMSETFRNSGSLIGIGVLSIIIGALQIFLAYFLGHGNNLVRMVFAVVASLNLAIGVWAALVLSGSEQISGLVSAIFSGLILYLLFNQRADEFFGHPYK
jgi:hypothetical protein